MLIFNADVFNEVITGTSTTWFSYPSFNGTIGTADTAQVYAYSTNVTGTGTQLNLWVDGSNDGHLWFGIANLLSGTNLQNGLVQQAVLAQVNPAFMRLRFTLIGLATGQCQLKLSVTGRSSNGLGFF